ncbi:MAG: hypothetical protein G8345_12235 [Magnetococcales bacterium]|nr:hypothetical protein [Magnetococcales bacterium]NGZ27641.1 hypothetical protein [Magnetococcales bacterium]
MTTTLLVTRNQLPPTLPHEGVHHLFLLHKGIRLVNHPFSPLPGGQRIYCAFGHSRLNPPLPLTQTTFSPGGLANLAEMIQESDTLLCNHRQASGLAKGKKRLGILLSEEKEQRLEGIRLAVGLAGCGHPITLLGVANFADLHTQLVEAKEYLQALEALSGRCLPQPMADMDFIVEL